MIAVAWVIERLVLRKLVNQEHITLLMATLGISYFLEGFGQTLFGSDIYKIDVGMPKDPVLVLDNMLQGGVLINKEDLYAAAIAAVLVALLALFFQKTATGRALRAVADDHQAAQSIGIPLGRIWIIVWSVAGVVALVAGVIWGSKLGVQFSLSLVALKALPVVILGGLTSVPGAIIGGLIIGVGEKLSEIYIGPMLGGGIEIWFAYVLALVFLLFRPQGLVRRKDHRPRLNEAPTLTSFTAVPGGRPDALPRKRSIQVELPRRPADLPDPARPDRDPALLLAVAFIAIPLLASDPTCSRAIFIPFLILSLAALGRQHPGRLLRPDLARHRRVHGGRRVCGLQLPDAYRGHAADRLAAARRVVRARSVGVLFGIPSLRIKGLYLAVATLAAQFFVDWACLRLKWVTNDSSSGSVSVAGLNVLGIPIESPAQKYLLSR